MNWKREVTIDIHNHHVIDSYSLNVIGNSYGIACDFYKVYDDTSQSQYQIDLNVSVLAQMHPSPIDLNPAFHAFVLR